MSLFIASLNSGSNGNCYYIGNNTEAVLVDVGISCKEIEIRMERLNLSLKKVKAIFISHEHSDHIKGVVVLSRKYQLPVYITPATLKYGRIKLDEGLNIVFKAYETISIGELKVTAFPKFHDASDPHSFIIEGNNTTVGVFTDIGRVCEHLSSHFSQCHAAFLEANYDEAMLDEGRYPAYLKTRIKGGEGHLSNIQALELFNSHRHSHLSHLFLSHLSKDNNKPELVQQLFEKHAGKTRIEIASRYNETAVYEIRTDNKLAQKTKPTRVPTQSMQMTLF